MGASPRLASTLRCLHPAQGSRQPPQSLAPAPAMCPEGAWSPQLAFLEWRLLATPPGGLQTPPRPGVLRSRSGTRSAAVDGSCDLKDLAQHPWPRGWTPLPQSPVSCVAESRGAPGPHPAPPSSSLHAASSAAGGCRKKGPQVRRPFALMDSPGPLKLGGSCVDGPLCSRRLVLAPQPQPGVRDRPHATPAGAGGPCAPGGLQEGPRCLLLWSPGP